MIIPPAGDVIREILGCLVQGHTVTGLRCTEELGRRLVDQTDGVVGIDDDNALTKMLDDVLVQFGKVGEIDAALPGECLTHLDPPGERTYRRGYGENDRPENTGGREVPCIADAGQL